jgi:hypothetical protein
MLLFMENNARVYAYFLVAAMNEILLEIFTKTDDRYLISLP